jgi:Fe-S cluster assembly protein SufD
MPLSQANQANQANQASLASQVRDSSSLTSAWCQQLQAHQANSQPSPLDEFRHAALDALADAGRLPGRKDEHWKYFSLQALEAMRPELNLPAVETDAGQQPSLLANTNACRLALRIGARLVGTAAEPGCLPPGLRLLNLGEALEEAGLHGIIRSLLAREELRGPGRVFQAMNTAALGTALDNTLVIHVAEGVDAGRVHLDWLPRDDAAGDATVWLENCRIIVVQESGSRLQLLESFSASAASPANPAAILNQVTQVNLGETAVFDHLRVQVAGANQHLFQTGQVCQAASSEYRYTGFELGGGLVRNELWCRLEGSAARSDLAAAFIGKGESCVDHHVLADHVAPACSSVQNFRGVLGDRSKGVFNGKALIRPGADGSSVRQSNANLLLSDLAEMNTKPELEIYADEVEASHGATVGQLDEAALFYLQSRGLSEVGARRMLTGAFCRAIGARLSDRKLVEQIEILLDAAMPVLAEYSEVTE